MIAPLLMMWLVGAAEARDPPYATLSQEIAIDRPADAAWARISGFCQVGAWLGASCAIKTPGPEGVGTIRRLYDRFEEVMVAKTARSYTYVVRNSPAGLAAGTVEIRPEGRRRSRVIYTAIYEPEAAPEARQAGQASRIALFQKLLAGMKSEAERAPGPD